MMMFEIEDEEMRRKLAFNFEVGVCPNEPITAFQKWTGSACSTPSDLHHGLVKCSIAPT